MEAFNKTIVLKHFRGDIDFFCMKTGAFQVFSFKFEQDLTSSFWIILNKDWLLNRTIIVEYIIIKSTKNPLFLKNIKNYSKNNYLFKHKPIYFLFQQLQKTFSKLTCGLVSINELLNLKELYHRGTAHFKFQLNTYFSNTTDSMLWSFSLSRICNLNASQGFKSIFNKVFFSSIT